MRTMSQNLRSDHGRMASDWWAAIATVAAKAADAVAPTAGAGAGAAAAAAGRQSRAAAAQACVAAAVAADSGMCLRESVEVRPLLSSKTGYR
jgi:hypothetical protein